VYYILEATALAEMFTLRAAHELIEPLTALVEGNMATFPDDVIPELRAHYADDPVFAWATGVRNARIEPAVPWDDKRDVEERVPGLIDPDDAREQCGPAVLAQARILCDIGVVTVVTEDIGPKPTRVSIAAACEALDLPWMRAATFLSDVMAL
jgi:hypothetical protein